jgi:phosphopantothenoylcysteine decarboxylase / phosphopantothenate---cysteine ligase
LRHNGRVARVLVGITGGIAAYKACELVRSLVRAGHDVFPLPTPGAERFVTAETFFALARRDRSSDPYPHLARADLLVIAPLTANTLAKLAHGLADNLLTEAALAHDGPVLVAPAMNTRMWEHPATQENVSVLVARGVELIGPAEGELAEGEVGLGRMAEPEAIAARMQELLTVTRSGSLEGLDVLVSAGGTREPLDDVRFLGNRSSGRMGVALAAEAERRGARVTLLAANVHMPPPTGVTVVPAPTAADLRREALERSGADVVLMAAAIADYRPAKRLKGKRPKDGQPWQVELVPTPDVLKAIGAARSDAQVLVAFGAEQGPRGLKRKRAMLEDKNVDLVVFNDVGREDIGFDAAENEVVLVSRDREQLVGKAPKERIAAAILDEVERLLGRRA